MPATSIHAYTSAYGKYHLTHLTDLRERVNIVAFIQMAAGEVKPAVTCKYLGLIVTSEQSEKSTRRRSDRRLHAQCTR